MDRVDPVLVLEPCQGVVQVQQLQRLFWLIIKEVIDELVPVGPAAKERNQARYLQSYSYKHSRRILL